MPLGWSCIAYLHFIPSQREGLSVLSCWKLLFIIRNKENQVIFGNNLFFSAAQTMRTIVWYEPNHCVVWGEPLPGMKRTIGWREFFLVVGHGVLGRPHEGAEGRLAAGSRDRQGGNRSPAADSIYLKGFQHPAFLCLLFDAFCLIASCLMPI